jgi:hypothetical protein
MGRGVDWRAPLCHREEASFRIFPSGLHEPWTPPPRTRHILDEEGRTCLSRIRRDVDQQRWWVDPTLGSITLSELSAMWVESNPTKTRSSVLRDQGILDLHIVPFLGAKRISAVTPGDVQSLVNRWASGDLAPRTVRRHYAVIKVNLPSPSSRTSWGVRHAGRSTCQESSINTARNWTAAI